MGAAARRLWPWLLGAVGITALGELAAATGCECTIACDPNQIPTQECAAGTCREVNGLAAGQCRASPPVCNAAAGCKAAAACPPGYSNASGTASFMCENSCGYEQAGIDAGSGKPATLFTAFRQYSTSKRRPWLESKSSGRSRRRRQPGKWSAGTLTCAQSECSIKDFKLSEGAEWAGTTPCAAPPEGGFLPARTSCTAKCKEGYYYQTGGDATRTCQTIGDPAKGTMLWSGKPLECTKKGKCDRTPDGAAGDSDWLQLASCSFGCGSKCRDRCEPQFRRPWVEGKPALPIREYTCDCDGATPEWKSEDGNPWEACVFCQDATGEPVSCDCDSAVGVPAAFARRQRGMEGDRVGAECAEGYIRTQQGEKYTYTCGNGTWTAVGRELHCRKVAPAPAPPAPGGLPDSAQKLLDRTGLSLVESLVIVLLCGMVLAAGLFAARRRVCAKGNYSELGSVLRQSFLGSDNLPGAQLADMDVEARWKAAADQREGSALSPTASRASSSRRRPKGRDSALTVMFRNDHLGELQPATWRQQLIGTGTYGQVYRATWREQDVALKVIKLPQRTTGSRSSTRSEEALRAKVVEVTKDFVQEIDVCCDLSHPNLVQLLGYADSPELVLVHELLAGDALDKQLYVEGWRPDRAEQLQAALDVASGMNYLHTFSQSADGGDQPILHRDLKSPNVLLTARPGSGELVTCKVTDFGLSRDKQLESAGGQDTAMMTGCGSVLWMAPEILLGERYNEKIDVYAFAMVLLELISRQLPWQEAGVSQTEVPHRVTSNDRPTSQLGEADRDIADLVKRCWHATPRRRPAFDEIVEELEEMRSHRSGAE